MTMTFSHAGIARRRTTVDRWCICHQCVFGYAIPIEIIDDEGGKKETRVCGEVCIVGMSVLAKNDNDDDGTTVTIADAAPTEATVTTVTLSLDSFPAPLSPVLRCNICRMEVVEQSSASSTKPCDVSDDDGTISEHN
jgi:hypothetical protein